MLFSPRPHLKKHVYEMERIVTADWCKAVTGTKYKASRNNASRNNEHGRSLWRFVRSLIPNRSTPIFEDYFTGIGAITRVYQRPGSDLRKRNKTTCMPLVWRQMGVMASQINSKSIVCSPACLSQQHRKYKIFALLVLSHSQWASNKEINSVS